MLCIFVTVSKNTVSVSNSVRHFGHEFNIMVMKVSLKFACSKKATMSDFSMSQRSSMWCFQTVGLKNVLLTENLCFNICDENIGKGNCCHFAHRSSGVLSIEVARIFFEN